VNGEESLAHKELDNMLEELKLREGVNSEYKNRSKEDVVTGSMANLENKRKKMKEEGATNDEGKGQARVGVENKESREELGKSINKSYQILQDQWVGNKTTLKGNLKSQGT
jgi:hypothetical protein